MINIGGVIDFSHLPNHFRHQIPYHDTIFATPITKNILTNKTKKLSNREKNKTLISMRKKQNPSFLTRNHRQNLQNDQLKIRSKSHNIPNFSHISNYFRHHSLQNNAPTTAQSSLTQLTNHDPRGFRRGV